MKYIVFKRSGGLLKLLPKPIVNSYFELLIASKCPCATILKSFSNRSSRVIIGLSEFVGEPYLGEDTL